MQCKFILKWQLHTQRHPGADHVQANRLFVFSVVVAAVKERGHIVPSSITGLSAHGCSLTFVCCTLNVSTHNGASKKPSPVVHRQHGRLSDKNVRWERDTGKVTEKEREGGRQRMLNRTDANRHSWRVTQKHFRWPEKVLGKIIIIRSNFCSSSLNSSHFVNSFPKLYFL